VGFTPEVTAGVWVGNFSGAPMWNVSGVSGAAPVWQDVMNHLHARVPSRQSPAPADLVSRSVAPMGSAEPAAEWFLSGTEPDAGIIEAAAARPRILSPISGEIIALDPDIPPGHETVPFKASSGAGLRWRLDDQDLGPAAEPYSWPPKKGSHCLELADASGRVLDRSEFAVRGESPASQDAREAGEDHPDSHPPESGGGGR
jgi:penicillin-binding protein 1C